MIDLYKLTKPLIFKMDPEKAHSLTIKALKSGAVKSCKTIKDSSLNQSLFGIEFPNPVGLSAGFDKNAEVISPIINLGFGFTEVGTVTPKPQIGNQRPRIFRDPTSSSVINAMGFPNGGLDVFKNNIKASRKPSDIVGINIGMNKEQTNPAEDYCALIRALAPMASYLTVNISSPNTPGLRDLQQKDVLNELLSELMAARKDISGGDSPALLVKLAPDLNHAQQEEIAEVLMDRKVDGVILSNTTLDRPQTLSAEYSNRKGGLSGAPVREKSTDIIRNFYKITEGKLPIIGVGGIQTAEHAYEKIKAGASLVQLYTGMIYEGPNIANNINAGLIPLLKQDGFLNINEAIGQETT